MAIFANLWPDFRYVARQKDTKIEQMSCYSCLYIPIQSIITVKWHSPKCIFAPKPVWSKLPPLQKHDLQLNSGCSQKHAILLRYKLYCYIKKDPPAKLNQLFKISACQILQLLQFKYIYQLKQIMIDQ
ncbi:Hypothetical_protein [Hexamita inflata]|uniref:Hypothetical_protein n=1 Tax=Hexamita inflata TaxID=28002 RepID=A0AA86UDX7_9EUKA|nr:Hypothetical protein HINF_LOCUS39539 [Hexamita inflata]